MAALPYMQLYVADYLADTAHLTTQEHGAYLLLMFNYWQRGESFKAKDEQSLNKRLASVSRMSIDDWNEVKDTLSEFFEVTETEWSQSRIERDLDAVNASVGQRSKAGKASAEARRLKKEQKTKEPFNEKSTPVEREENNRSTNKDTDTDTDTDTEIKTLEVSQSDNLLSQKNLPSATASKKPSDYPEWFEELWKLYPAREGSTDKRKAYHAANARKKEGASIDQLRLAVISYYDFSLKKGNIGTPFVMQAATFFGKGGHIENTWRISNEQQKSFNAQPQRGLENNDTDWINGVNID